MLPNFVQRVDLARTGGKQAILKRADHRFIERIELVSHNGSTSFPQLRALRKYHECAERCKNLSKRLLNVAALPDCGLYCGVESTVETIQVVLDKKLLQATDRAALRTKRNRSALVRDALREHLRRLTLQSLEERDRMGYAERPAGRDEAALWESEAAWPKE